MPMKRELYPRNWKKISKDVIQKAGNCCEWCGLRNHLVGVRVNGRFIETPHLQPGQMIGDRKVFMIVLTVMHLDHNPQNCDYSNLRAACQKCHLAYDHQHHMANAAATRRRKRDERSGQLSMLV